MTSPAPSRRRWFSYSLRTFFVALTLFCVWLGVQVKWIRDRHQFLAECDAPEEAGWYRATPQKRAPGALPLFGEMGVEWVYVRVPEADVRFGFVGDVSVAPKKSTPALARVIRLFPEAEVYGAYDSKHGEETMAVPVEERR